jgi:hypothetical protein
MLSVQNIFREHRVTREILSGEEGYGGQKAEGGGVGGRGIVVFLFEGGWCCVQGEWVGKRG